MKPVEVKAQLVEGEIDFSLWQSDVALAPVPAELFEGAVAAYNGGGLGGLSHLRDMTVSEIVPESNEVYVHFFLRKFERTFRFLLARSFAGVVNVYGLEEKHAGQVERGNLEVATMIRAALASQTWGENLFDVISVGQYFPIPLDGEEDWVARFIDLAVDDTPAGMVLVPGRSTPLIKDSKDLARLWFKRFLARSGPVSDDSSGSDSYDFFRRNSLTFAAEVAVQYFKTHNDPKLIAELFGSGQAGGGPAELSDVLKGL
jgi:hypothetical protein